MALRIRRGTEAQRSGITFEQGELIYTTDTKRLYLGDSVTQGGTDPFAGIAGVGLHYNTQTGLMDANYSGLTTDSIAEGIQAGKQYFTNERAQDAVAAALLAGVHTNISFVYNTTQDNANRIDAIVTLDGVGIASVQADTSPRLGGNLGLNTHDITGIGNIDITGSVSATTFNLSTISIEGDSYLTHVVTSRIHTDDVVDGGLSVYATAGNSFSMNYYGGTRGTPTPITAGNTVGALSIKGYNGSTYEFAGAIVAQWDDTATTTSAYPASNVSIVAGNNTSSPVFATLSTKGVFTVPVMQTGVYTSSPNTRPTGAKGMIIFNDTTSKFQGFDGTSWVDLN